METQIDSFLLEWVRESRIKELPNICTYLSSNLVMEDTLEFRLEAVDGGRENRMEYIGITYIYSQNKIEV